MNGIDCSKRVLMRVWGLPFGKFDCCNTKSPNVRLVVVDRLRQYFRTHPKRTANSCELGLQGVSLAYDGNPKISNLYRPSLKQQITGFYISVDYRLRV